MPAATAAIHHGAAAASAATPRAVSASVCRRCGLALIGGGLGRTGERRAEPSVGGRASPPAAAPGIPEAIPDRGSTTVGRHQRALDLGDDARQRAVVARDLAAAG